MEEETRLLPLTPRVMEDYWLFISDKDVVQGSDGQDWIYEKTMLWYIRAKLELEKTIKKVETGVNQE